MSEVSKNTTPITLEEFKERVKNRVYQLKNYYSLFITPSGDLIDCGYPQALCHNGYCVNVYENLDKLPESLYNSALRGLDIPFDDVSYYLMDYHGILDVIYTDPSIYMTVNKFILSSEDKICQDLGFVKVAINESLKTFEVVVPNSIFEKKVTAAQKETVSKLSEMFNLDIDTRLKSEQKSNATIAMEVANALRSIKKA